MKNGDLPEFFVNVHQRYMDCDDSPKKSVGLP